MPPTGVGAITPGGAARTPTRTPTPTTTRTPTTPMNLLRKSRSVTYLRMKLTVMTPVRSRHVNNTNSTGTKQSRCAETAKAFLCSVLNDRAPLGQLVCKTNRRNLRIWMNTAVDAGFGFEILQGRWLLLCFRELSLQIFVLVGGDA